MTNTTNKILDKIKSDKIAPKPKWQFRLEQVGLWSLAVLSVLIGSNAVAAIIFRMVNNDWDALKYLERSPVGHTLTTLPYLWLVVLGMFILLAYYNTRHTKKGYRYNTYGLVLGAVMASLIVGSVLYAAGIGPRINRFMEQVPLVQNMMHDRERIWTQSDEGFIAGEITEILSGVGIFQVIDLEGNNWVVRPGENITIHPVVEIKEGNYVRIIGDYEDEELFIAEQILPWEFGPPNGERIPPRGFNNGQIRPNFRRMK